MSFEGKNADLNATLTCNDCGATLQYAPGTYQLTCAYCGTINEIEHTDTGEIQALDYEEFIKGHARRADEQMEALVVQCQQCGAQTSLPESVTSEFCVFCSSPLVLSLAKNEQLLRPHYILPFLIKAKEAESHLSTWIGKLWFAPNALIKNVKEIQRDHFVGIYLPHWAYNAETDIHYHGKKGVHPGFLANKLLGKRTRWYQVANDLSLKYENVLVLASKSLSRKVADELEPWQLDKLQIFDERYLSGLRSETYRIDAVAGLEIAKEKFEKQIIQSIQADIGGDEQLIDNHKSTIKQVKLKYCLLPIWISAFQFKNKVYQVAINASTGRVIGDRPYSTIKIAFGVLGFLVAMAIYFYIHQYI
ncbi:replication restart DNA helicase PriA [bacterium A37T11]|nr:replication restart DNA helicase PriA [bacterium A37T11]